MDEQRRDWRPAFLVRSAPAHTNRRPGGSLAYFRKATAAYPEYYEAHYHAGVAELRLGHHAEAMQAFQKAIDLSGGRYARAAFGIGYLLYLEGNPGEAEKVIRRGLEVDDHSPDGH